MNQRLRWDPDDLSPAQLAAVQRAQVVVDRKGGAGKNKYHARAERIDGIRFHSEREATYYSELKLRRVAGEIKFFLRQVPIDLPGGIRYFVDFFEAHADGSIHFVDVKGIHTDVFVIKRKQVEELYPIRIEIVR